MKKHKKENTISSLFIIGNLIPLYPTQTFAPNVDH